MPRAVFRQGSRSDDVSGRVVARWQRTTGAGALSAAIAAREKGLKAVAVPETNAREAAVADGIKVFALKSLPQAVDLVNSPESFDTVRVNAEQLLSEAAQYAVEGHQIGRPSRVPLTEQLKSQIVGTYQHGGDSLRAIAARFGTSLGTVQRCIAAYQKGPAKPVANA